jgi:hypothetical protein
MLGIALVGLFVLAATASALVLADSFVRGRAAWRHLRRERCAPVGPAGVRVTIVAGPRAICPRDGGSRPVSRPGRAARRPAPAASRPHPLPVAA